MQHLTDLTLVLDRSGSMNTCRDAMERVLTAYVEDQKRLPNPCVFSLVTFDDEVKTMFTAAPIASVGRIEINPGGSTALLAAIGKTIDETGARLRNMPEHMRPNKVLIVIVTDGGENSSHIYDRAHGTHYVQERIFEMIRHQRERYQWEFMFLGADQDAIATATSVGISAGNALNFCAARGGWKGPRGAEYIGQSLSLGTKKLRESEEKTCGTLLSAYNASEEETRAAYNTDFAGQGAVDNKDN